MLEIIATIVFIYLIFRVFTQYVLPFLVKKFIERAKKKFYRDNPHIARDEQKKEGEMTITFRKEKNSTDIDNLGEYTDFEDIKEK